MSATPSLLRSESGVALVIVLVLAAVSLTLITALLYLVTVGTRTSGVQKRYRTALEACVAGSDIVKQIIEVRGDNTAITTFLNGLTGLNAAQNVSSSCAGTAYSPSTSTFTGPGAKIMTSSTTWNAACGSTNLITDPTSYDFTFQLGTSPRFNVYAKIVDMREGNTLSTTTSGSQHMLVKNPVVSFSNGEIGTPTVPYLYTFELDCENASKSDERVKLSVLYQF
jgi:hypothetical protein